MKELASEFAIEKYLSSKKTLELRKFGRPRFTQKVVVLYTATTNIAQTYY